MGRLDSLTAPELEDSLEEVYDGIEKLILDLAKAVFTKADDIAVKLDDADSLKHLISRFMPFPYAMNALRECVAGFYGNRYLMNLGILLLFAVLFMLIGMICHVLNRGMHHKIEEVKAKTDLMI